MIDYRKIFALPFTDWKKYIIGVLLSILPIINFFAYGYILETATGSMRRRYSLPEWKKPGKLFLTGLQAFLIFFLYLLPAFIITLIAKIISKNYLKQMLLDQTTPETFLLLILSLGPLLLVFLFLFILALYLFPVAILIFADSKKFGHAFNMHKVLQYSFSKHYAGPWLISFFVFFLLSSILNFIPFIGNGIASFTGLMIMFNVLATAYGSAKQARL